MVDILDYKISGTVVSTRLGTWTIPHPSAEDLVPKTSSAMPNLRGKNGYPEQYCMLLLPVLTNFFHVALNDEY